VHSASSQRSGGFTLLEMMVVVAIIGILASIAIPAFLAYQNRARRSEAYTNVSAIVKLEKSFFSEYNVYADTNGSWPGVPAIGVAKRPWNALADANFQALGWRPEGDVYYDYGVITGITCGVRDCFTAGAYGDVDGNGLTSAIEYVEPSAGGVMEPDLLGLPPPTDPVTLRVKLSEVAQNYAADLY
jgi:prepilin-type N-terminal cleavage/methylation domain-containing protein